MFLINDIFALTATAIFPNDNINEFIFLEISYIIEILIIIIGLIASRKYYCI